MNNACPRIDMTHRDQRAKMAEEVEQFEKDVKAFVEQTPGNVLIDFVIDERRTRMVYICDYVVGDNDQQAPFIAGIMLDQQMTEALFVLSEDGPNHYHHNAIHAKWSLNEAGEALLDLKATSEHEYEEDATVLGLDRWQFGPDSLIKNGLPYSEYRQLVELVKTTTTKEPFPMMEVQLAQNNPGKAPLPPKNDNWKIELSLSKGSNARRTLSLLFKNPDRSYREVMAFSYLYSDSELPKLEDFVTLGCLLEAMINQPTREQDLPENVHLIECTSFDDMMLGTFRDDIVRIGNNLDLTMLATGDNESDLVKMFINYLFDGTRLATDHVAADDFELQFLAMVVFRQAPPTF